MVLSREKSHWIASRQWQRAISAHVHRLLATTPTEELLGLDMLQPGNIADTLHAYQMAKRCNEKRVMAQAVAWGERGAFITGTDVLVDGGATASYFYGPLQPAE